MSDPSDGTTTVAAMDVCRLKGNRDRWVTTSNLNVLQGYDNGLTGQCLVYDAARGCKSCFDHVPRLVLPS